MKKTIKKALVFILTLVVFGTYTLYSNQSANTVYADNISQSTKISDLFPDENLANVVAEILNKSVITDMVTQSELDSITSIFAYSKNISSIEGLNYLNNLDEIYMYNNLISDLTPIANLTNLSKITLSYNLVYDITPLSNLEELLDISISNNQIEDLSPVTTLNKLTRLEIANNNISDLSPLYGMSFSSLEVLTLTGNQLDNVELFNHSYFPILSDLWLDNNKVSDITPLQNLPMVEYLSFDNNEVENIEPLTHLSNLKYVWGIGNHIFDVSPINQFTDLNVKSFQNQTIILSPIDYSSDIEIEYPIIGYSGSLLQPNLISNNGTLDNNKIQWNDLDINVGELEITFSETWSDNGALSGRFSGTVIQPIDAPTTYSITYDLDGGINNTSNPSEYVYGIGVSSFEQPTKEGHTFIGWFDNSDNEITSISTTDSEDRELFARWIPNKYTITYNLDGGINSNSNPLEYVYGVGVSSFAQPTKEGYTFVGWFDSSDKEITSITTTESANKELSAKWVVNEPIVEKYTVKFDTRGGTDIPVLIINKGDLISLVANPTKEGYTFAGWYTSLDYNTKWDFKKDIVERDMSLYAKWDEIMSPNNPTNTNPDITENNVLPQTGILNINVFFSTMLIILGFFFSVQSIKKIND